MKQNCLLLLVLWAIPSESFVLYNIFWTVKQQQRTFLLVLIGHLSLLSSEMGADCKSNCSRNHPWKISSGSALHSVTEHFIWTIQCYFQVHSLEFWIIFRYLFIFPFHATFYFYSTAIPEHWRC